MKVDSLPRGGGRSKEAMDGVVKIDLRSTTYLRIWLMIDRKGEIKFA